MPFLVASILVSSFRSSVPPLNTVIETLADLPELHKCPPLDGYVKIGNISQTPIDQFLVLILPQPLDEAARGQRLTQPNRRQPILRETEVEQRRDFDGRGAELLLLFDVVGAAHVADGAFVTESGEQSEHFGGCML